MAVPKILIVDNDYETCAYVSDVLADAGFCVDVASDAQTALEKCKSHDVLLVESNLPDMDGVELFRRAKRLRANIRAILVTSVRTYEKLQAAIDAGMWGVLSKPLNANRLVSMIEEVAGETG
jgi:two-component system alkaline phosphatase synthesis response regulator PhoP